MARGDRSRSGHERTPEERERDRQERERRRAGRGGEAAPEQEVPAPREAPAPPQQEHGAVADENWFSEDPPAPQPPSTASTPAPPAAAPPPAPAPREPPPDPAPAAAPASPLEEQDRERSLVGDPDADAQFPAAADSVLAGAAAAPPPDEPQQPRPAIGGATTGERAAGGEGAGEKAAGESMEALPPPPPPPPPLPPAAEEQPATPLPVSVPPPLLLDDGTAASAGGRGRRAGSHSRRSWLARLAAVVALVAVIGAVFLLLRSLFSSSSSHAPAPPPVVKVVIPEGKTRAQIARIASASGLSGSYLAASKHSPLLNPLHYGAPHGTTTLEGFLFPATYDTNPGEPASRLVEDQLIAFKENFGATEVSRARALHVTPYELLTVASMVEREAEIPSDRAKIAAVIYNRLSAGMPLGIDASIYYAVEARLGIATYTHELTEAQLHIDSPYNTRTHTGLPPTPISNPGAASIAAAAHPAHVDYLYYVAGADGCGEQVFSTTLAAFETNAAAYHAAVRANGGQPPKCKHK